MANRKSSRKASRKSSRKASRKSSRKASRKSSRANRKSHRGSRRNMMGGGIARYIAAPVTTLGKGASNVFENLLTSTGKVAHNAVYGVSGALERAATAMNKAVGQVPRNPLKARTRRHRRS